MSPQLLVRLDGETDAVPLDDLTWEYVAPCGCTCGVMVPDSADEDAEFRRFHPNAEVRRRKAAAGFLFRLAKRGPAIDRIKDQCQHDPRYGVEKIPVPVGHRWAEARSGRREHIVAVPDDADERRFSVWVSPICGGKTDLYGDPWDDLAECTRCERKAREMAAEATS